MFDNLTNRSDDFVQIGADNANPPEATAMPSWQDDIRHGDILAFRFPFAEDGATGRPKLRPVVVLDVATIAGQRFAIIAYGTSATGARERGYSIFITRPEALAELNLRKPTRFECARRIVVSLSNSGFERPHDRPTPLIGRLSGEEFERMNDVRARIHAEADIAAEARTERRRGRTAPRPVIVEQRPRRRVSLPTRTRTMPRAMPRRAG